MNCRQAFFKTGVEMKGMPSAERLRQLFGTLKNEGELQTQRRFAAGSEAPAGTVKIKPGSTTAFSPG